MIVPIYQVTVPPSLVIQVPRPYSFGFQVFEKPITMASSGKICKIYFSTKNLENCLLRRYIYANIFNLKSKPWKYNKIPILDLDPWSWSSSVLAISFKGLRPVWNTWTWMSVELDFRMDISDQTDKNWNTEPWIESTIADGLSIEYSWVGEVCQYSGGGMYIERLAKSARSETGRKPILKMPTLEIGIKHDKILSLQLKARLNSASSTSSIESLWFRT